VKSLKADDSYRATGSESRTTPYLMKAHLETGELFLLYGIFVKFHEAINDNKSWMLIELIAQA
jgi:hypothetical protein